MNYLMFLLKNISKILVKFQYNKFYSISPKHFLQFLSRDITVNHHIEVFSMILVGFPSIMDERSGPHALQFVSLFRTSTIYLLLVYSLSENSYPKAFAWKFPLFSFLFFPFLLNYFLFVFSYFKSFFFSMKNIADFLSITIFFEIPDFLKKMNFSIGYESD